MENTYEEVTVATQDAMSAMQIALTPYVNEIHRVVMELGLDASPDDISKALNTQELTNLAKDAADDLTTKMNGVMEEFAPFDHEQKQQKAQYTNTILWKNDNTHRNTAGGSSTKSNPRLKLDGTNMDGITPQEDLPDSIQSIEADFANKKELTFKLQLKFTPAQAAHDKRYTHKFTTPTPQLKSTPRFEAQFPPKLTM